MKLSAQVKWIFIAGLLLSALVFLLISNQQKKLWEEKFFNEVQREMTILKGRLDINERVLLGIGSFFQASGDVDLNQFKIYVSPSIQNYKFIQALEWVPRVLWHTKIIHQAN